MVAHARAFFPDVVVAAVPNGGRRGKREAASLKAEGVLAGYPDLLVDAARGGYFGLRIEMKRADGRGVESAEQRGVRRRLERAGYRSVVCVGAEAAIRELETYLHLPPTRVARRGTSSPLD